MRVVNIPTMIRLIDSVAVRKRRPLFIWGKSGTGKSAGVRQAAANHNAVLVDMRVSQYEAVDIRGIPDIQTGLTVWNMPSTLPFKGNPKFSEDDGLIFLFIDEINQGDPSTLAVLYQLILDRRVGEHELMDNVVIVAAGNLDSDRGATTRWPYPLGNRGTHVEVDTDTQAFTSFASAEQWDARLIGFLNFRTSLLHTFDSSNPQKAFASSRSWSYVNEDLADTQMSDEDRLVSFSGSVGEGPAVEFAGFLDIMHALVPIEDIIADPMGVAVESRLDVQWAMAVHIAGNMDKTNARPLHRFLTRLQPEMVIMAWTMAIGRDEDLTDSDAFLLDYAPAYRSLFTN